MNLKRNPRLLLAIAATAASLAAPLLPAAQALDCGALCATWALDEGFVDDTTARIDAALASYREPRRAPRIRFDPLHDEPGDEPGSESPRADAGPQRRQDPRNALRQEVEGLLRAPARLSISVEGQDVVLSAPPQSARRFSPGEPHARVDAAGIARIRTELGNGRLVITQRYDRHHLFRQAFTVQRDGHLEVTREVRRPGLKTLQSRAAYHLVADGAGGG